MKKFFAIVTVFVISASAVFAQGAWTFDRAHSGLRFAVSHMVVSEQKGRFDDFKVDVKSDKEDFSDAQIEVTINMNTINTEDGKRDGHLKSDDFFSVAKFPTAVFKSTQLQKVGGNQYKLVGTLTMKGVTKPITLDLKLNGVLKGQGKDKNTSIAGFKMSGVINRKDWGITYGRVLDTGGLAIGEEVTLEASVELNRTM